jgi:UDP-N-acetylmuramoyl-tripeptide--D-alanyl-D-alanine ligase
MKALVAEQIAVILGVSIAAGNPEACATGEVSTDSRKLRAGCVFFALRGENFDGDKFAAAALSAGAAVAVVQRWAGEVPVNCAVIVVPDTLLALQRLACWWRKQLDIPVIAITGSNGKTSTKDFTTSVLAQNFKVASTQGNLNNHIGVPLTVLATTESDEVAVWEMGMNHSGEIAPLCEIARPKYGIITNIGSAHIEFLGTREAIAEEKGMLGRALPTDGTLFLPATCEYFDYLRQRTRAGMIAVGNGRGLVRAENLRCEKNETYFTLVIEGSDNAEVILHVAGRHMVTNALLAAGVGWKLGMSSAAIAKGLSRATLNGGRLGRYESGGITVIDDTYNANPESMASAIETLAEMPVAADAQRIIVLGRMGELGVHAAAAHLQVGELAFRHKLSVIAVGEGAEGIAEGAHHCPFFKDFATAAEWLQGEVKPGDVVLFKGSRTATIERVMHAVFPRN